MIKKLQSIKWIQVLIWFFPVLFLIDNILGFNGYQFTIAGKGIRIILFAITVAELCLYCLYVMLKEKISLLPKKDGTDTFRLTWADSSLYFRKCFVGNSCASYCTR